MLRYIGKRLLEVLPTTFGIILLTFVLFNVVGGSPAQVILGKNATAESIAAFNHKYGYTLMLARSEIRQNIERKEVSKKLFWLYGTLLKPSA